MTNKHIEKTVEENDFDYHWNEKRNIGYIKKDFLCRIGFIVLSTSIYSYRVVINA
jgi:hypothetical protein